MKSTNTLYFLSISAGAVKAQISLYVWPTVLCSSRTEEYQSNTANHNYDCPPRGGNYCLGTSLMSSMIVRCHGTVGTSEDCGEKHVPRVHLEEAC